MHDAFATIGDTRFHYVEAGEGPLVILLHGFPEYWYSWRKQIAPLAAAGFRVIAPDLPGYNDSSKPRHVDAYRVTSLANDIAGLILATNAGRPAFVVGHDWGGFIAWFLAMLHPDIVRRLIVLNVPHPVPYSRELRRSLRQKRRSAYQLFFSIPVLPVLALRWTLPLLMKRMGRFTSEEIREYQRAWRKPRALASMLAYYRALRWSRGQLRAATRKIDAPVLMIWGEREPVFTWPTTQDFAEWVPDCRIERIAHAGHFVQTDAPDRVTQLIVNFCVGPT